MEIEIKKHDPDVIEFTPIGELDTYTSEDFAEKLANIIDSGTMKVILNFKTITYVSSLGIGEIIQGWDRLRTKGGALRFACMSESVYKVFKLVGLTKRFEIFPSFEEALQSFQA
ncbi:STAS domain-containing protein [candidate division CSSED10-310 bacterium]|uniref:Anti-sigma factor antagonist n=1 Tax=candidate division CSSED10-310 bacterium TaxID=2855610 RepID=A0ABV6YU60_UNCC1